MDIQKKNKILWVVIGVLAAALIATVVMLIVIMGKAPAQLPAATEPAPQASAGPAEEVTPEDTQPAETEPPVIPETPAVEIETPYCTLYYPGEWEELLQVEQTEGEVHTVSFSCKLEEDNTIELFQILFGVEQGIGAVKTPEGELVKVTAQSMDIVPGEDWTNSQINIVFTMQEALNHVLERIEFEAQSNEPFPIPEDDTPMDVDAQVCVLKYPARWEEYLVTEQGENSIKFSAKIGEHEAEHMFTVYFGGEVGIEAGAVKLKDGGNETLRLDVAQPELDGTWSDDEKRILLAMQEDMNYLLMNLPA